MCLCWLGKGVTGGRDGGSGENKRENCTLISLTSVVDKLLHSIIKDKLLNFSKSITSSGRVSINSPQLIIIFS